MSALSIWTYYWNNKRKVLPVTGIVALAILAISVTGAITESLFADFRRELAPLDHYAFVFSSQQVGMSDDLVAWIGQDPTVADTMPLAMRHVRTQGVFGSQGEPVYFLLPDNQPQFADTMGWGLIEGRWPTPGTNEVALTENIMKNRDLHIGDSIGNAVNKNDSLNGEWRVVGYFPTTEVSGGLGDLGYFQSQFVASSGLPADLADRRRALIIVPAAGKGAELGGFLDSLPNDQVSVVYRAKAQREFTAEVANADMIVWLLNAATIVVMALALGLLNIIFFMHRANEFGLLAALGYTRRFLMRRTFLEAAVTAAMGWALGILLSQGIYSLVNYLVFSPKGLSPLRVLTPRVLTFTIPVPVAVTVFSVAVVMWLLWRLDPVAIIERRD